MQVPPRIVLASANPKKVVELRSILDAAHLRTELVERPADVAEVIEDAATFEGNARLKAIALAGATGLSALADDSGLEVDALDGAPGVHSARYAGAAATDDDNVALLLAELDRVGATEPPQRAARFRCVLVLRSPAGDELVAEGTVEGRVAAGPAGSSGFGYDPVFVPDGADGRTFAQMDAGEKHAISHRGRALEALVAQLTA